MKRSLKIKVKWCLALFLCLSLFTPALAMAQWWGSDYYYESSYYEESYSDCFCDGGYGRGDGGYYLPSIGGCNYSRINYDD